MISLIYIKFFIIIMNLIYVCVFLNKDQLELLKLFLFSVLLYSDIELFDLVVITSVDFLEDINNISKLFNIHLKTMVTNCKTIEDSMMNRYKIFEYLEIDKYSKILYLDLDILMQADLNILFNLEIEDKIYAVPQNNTNIELPHFGGELFDFTQIDKNIQGINGGVLLFQNTNTMRSLFNIILNHRDELVSKNISLLIMDQSLLNYHCNTKKLFGSNILSKYINLSHPLENPISPLDNANIISNHFYDKGKLSKFNRLKYHLLHLLNILKNKEANNNSLKHILLKQYKWNIGNIIFDHDGILRTTWGIGKYKLINDHVGIASWCGIDHTIIFNKLYNNFVSINNLYIVFDNHSEHTILCILGEKYCVDKSPFFGGHTYTPEYHKLFYNKRNKIKLLLEIGIGNIPLMKNLTNNNYRPGASLRMWKDYFSVNKTNIVGCDILENVLFTDDRITTFQVDQNNIESLNNLITKVKNIEEYADIIIDDGSHQEEHMITSFRELWKLVNPDEGIYIIEDIHSSFIERIINLNKEHCIYVHRGINKLDNFVAFQKKI